MLAFVQCEWVPSKVITRDMLYSTALDNRPLCEHSTVESQVIHTSEIQLLALSYHVCMYSHAHVIPWHAYRIRAQFINRNVLCCEMVTVKKK